MIATMPLTPDSMTDVLAYIHHYTPNFLPGRCLPATDLRQMAAWLIMPQLALRSARANPRLAIHLALGHAAGLLSVAEGYWRTTLQTLPWLEAGWTAQLTHLQRALLDEEAWTVALTALNLGDTFPVDYLAYVTQQIARQYAMPEPPCGLASWLAEAEADETWRLALPERLPPDVRFHLLQMGDWTANDAWQGTAASIARAAQQGYSLTRMEAVLCHATGQALTPHQQQQLLAWYQRHDAYCIRPIYLLSVKEPAHLDAVMRQQRWRAHIGQRLCRRHAVVSPRLIPLLERRLAQEGYILDAPPPEKEPNETQQLTAASWLALEVLAGLGKLISLPFTLPTRSRWRLEEQISPTQRAALALQAQQVLDGLSDALRGRDAYYPAERPVDPDLLAVITTALNEERELAITYQGLGDAVPRLRKVEPHRLEERGQRMYLRGYCYLAESDRTFRLDRIHTWQLLDT